MTTPQPTWKDEVMEILGKYGAARAQAFIDMDDAEYSPVAERLKAEALAAITKLVEERIIGEDEVPLWNDDEYDNLWCQECSQYQNNDGDCWCKPKNQLRAQQRTALGSSSGEQPS